MNANGVFHKSRYCFKTTCYLTGSGTGWPFPADEFVKASALYSAKGETTDLEVRQAVEGSQ